MTISAAIIMKNEERVIERCLTGLSKLADEVIVVDTGSTDRSKELAAKFSKVRLFDSAFFTKDTHYSDFEFGKAKNEAIRRCTGDWVIWADADDLFDDDTVAKIREIEASEKRTCLHEFTVVCGAMRIKHCRMFTNGKGILFDENHACHEFINTLGFPLILRHDVEIQHLPGHKGVASHDRNLAIMEKDYYVRHREDQRTLFYLANAYRDSGSLAKAAEFYEKYLKISQWREERFFAFFFRAQCLFRLGKVDEGRDEVLKALGEDYRFAEAFCFLGDVEIYKENWERAILWFRLALTTPFPKDARLFASEISYSQYPTARIGECMAKLGIKEDANTLPALKQEIFELPEDRGLAMLAAAALSNIVSAGRAKVSVVPANDWQKAMIKRFETLNVGSGAGKKLSLPINLKSVHAQEWYARSAGYIDISQEPVRIVKQDTRSSKHVIITPDTVLSEAIVEKIHQAGKDLVLLEPNCEFQQAEVVFRDGVVYIGCAGWLQHLAKWTRIPAFVSFDGRNPKEFGWEDQENHSEGDFAGLEKFLDRSLT
jgi:glycosyltransferase involved in cell wall biosynthesis